MTGNKIKYKIRFGYAAAAVLIIVFFVVNALEYRALERELPAAVEWYAQDGFALSDGGLERLAKSDEVGFFADVEQPVTEEVMGTTEQMRVRLADQAYFDILGLKARAGSWQDMFAEGGAAVSDAWALAHYKYLDVTGRKICVGDTEYVIRAVYAASGSARQRLAQDGADVVYMDCLGGLMPEDSCVQYLYFPKDGTDFSCNKNLLSDRLMQLTGSRMEPDCILDTESVRHVAKQNLVIALWMFLIVSAVFFSRRSRCVFRYVTLLAVLALPVFYRWYIPADYLGMAHIFDISGYFARYVSGQNQRHLMHETGYYGNLAQIHVAVSWALLAFWGVCMLCAFMKIYTLKNASDKNKRHKFRKDLI